LGRLAFKFDLAFRTKPTLGAAFASGEQDCNTN
jgi:hypothetical protein